MSLPNVTGTADIIAIIFLVMTALFSLYLAYYAYKSPYYGWKHSGNVFYVWLIAFFIVAISEPPLLAGLGQDWANLLDLLFNLVENLLQNPYFQLIFKLIGIIFFIFVAYIFGLINLALFVSMNSESILAKKFGAKRITIATISTCICVFLFIVYVKISSGLVSAFQGLFKSKDEWGNDSSDILPLFMILHFGGGYLILSIVNKILESQSTVREKGGGLMKKAEHYFKSIGLALCVFIICEIFWRNSLHVGDEAFKAAIASTILIIFLYKEISKRFNP